MSNILKGILFSSIFSCMAACDDKTAYAGQEASNVLVSQRMHIEIEGLPATVIHNGKIGHININNNIYDCRIIINTIDEKVSQIIYTIPGNPNQVITISLLDEHYNSFQFSNVDITN